MRSLALFCFALAAWAGGAAIDPSTGAFSWTPSSGQAPALHGFLVEVTDQDGLSDTTTVTAIVSSTMDGSDVAGDTLSAAATVSAPTGPTWQTGGYVGMSLSGSLDVDLYRFTLAEGDTLVADVDALFLDDGNTSFSMLDSYLRLFDSAGTELAYNDSAEDPETGEVSQDAALTFVAPSAGTYYLGLSGAGNAAYDPAVAASGVAGSTGNYYFRWTVSQAPPA